VAAAKPLTEGAFLNPKRPSPPSKRYSPKKKPPSPPSGRYSPQKGEKRGERQDPFHRALRSHMLTACIALGILDSRRDERECFAMI
jgi:hypothetical protein